MSSTPEADVLALVEAASKAGAKPFKDATGDWSTAVEVALLDAMLSIGAQVDGQYGAGVLPRLRGFKAFRGPANMMRVIATLGPFGLGDFIAEQDHIDRVMDATAKLLDAGVNTADDVDPTSDQQRQALLAVEGVPALAWGYFLIGLGHTTTELDQLRNTWLDRFVARATTHAGLSAAERDELVEQAAAHLHDVHQRRSYGYLPEFTVPQLQQAIFRAEYAQSTASGQR